MTTPVPPSDEMLVAFLDNELAPPERQAVQDQIDSDPSVAARLAFLARSELPFAAAFDKLTAEAPLSRLEAMVSTLPSSSEAHRAARGGRVQSRRWLLAAAACVAMGVVLDRSVVVLRNRSDGTDPNWRDVVANYMMLYSSETLNELQPESYPGPREMARLSDEIGVDLSLAKVEVPGIPIRRAQMLSFKGAPLVQIAYLDPVSGPMAFCLIRKDGTDGGLRTERRFGMPVVYWSSPKHAFLVIGHGDASALERIAGNLRLRVQG